MPLTARQRQHLKGLAHKRKPVVAVGAAGITPAVLAELDKALERHELLKIKLPAVEREEREEMMNTLSAQSGAEAVQQIGRIAVLYRRAKKPRIEVPG